MSKDVDFCKLDKDFGTIQDGTTLIQRCILSMACHFPEGMRYDNPSLGRIFQVSPGRISHLVSDLNEKGFIHQLLEQSKSRIIYLNETHPTLLKIAKYHENLKELHSSKQQSRKCLHCYFELSTWLKVAKSLKELTEKKEKRKLPDGKKDNSFSAFVPPGSPSPKRAARETATSYTPSAAFENFWGQVRFSKGDRFPAWQTWQKLDIESKGLADRVVAALKAATPEWQRREPQYRPRVAKWLSEGSWMNNGQDDEARPKKSLEWPDPPAEVLAEDFRRAKEASL